jgi:hypothetical protein
MVRHPPRTPTPWLGSLTALGLALNALTPGWAAAEGPTLWGYGVKSCRELVAAVPAAGAEVAGNAEYPRYREWLAGLVSGLNLATGLDVLKGAELEAALTRIRAHCQERPEDDFFNASLALVKSLGTTAGKGRD